MDNNPDWNSFWAANLNMSSIFRKYHHARIFSSYRRILDKTGIKNPDVIEIGCGTGELTARIIERYGGTAALVDSSETALKIASGNFLRRKMRFRIFKQDALKFRPERKYGIVHSEGLIEHFSGDEQKKILEVHRQCASDNGFVLISVPRKIWYYSIARYVFEKTGKWPFGDEKPMDAKALKSLLEENGFSVKECFNSGRFAFALASPEAC